MDIAFLGGVFPKHLEKEIIDNSIRNIDYAANNFQWSLIDGLDMCNKAPVHLCNIMFIRSYPKGYKKSLIRTHKFSHHPDSSDINIGFVNLIGFNMFSRFIAAIKGLFLWARKKDNKKVVVIYSLHTPFLLAACIITLFFKSIKTCIIVPDLPSFMTDNTSLLYRFFKKIDISIINLCLKRIHSFVLLSEFMAEKLPVGNRHWIRIEGIFNVKRYSVVNIKNENKVIMYSGDLNISNGILDLLSAFILINNNNYRLWITGNGNGLHEILKASVNDKRITYYPRLEQKDLFSLQQQATLLVNPLSPDNHKIKYFFPSKTMEFMASGTPTLMHKLQCIPDEYHQYLYFFDDHTNEGMRNKIIELCEMTSEARTAFGESARDFIFKKKNQEIQCSAIHKMLESLF